MDYSEAVERRYIMMSGKALCLHTYLGRSCRHCPDTCDCVIDKRLEYSAGLHECSEVLPCIKTGAIAAASQITAEGCDCGTIHFWMGGACFSNETSLQEQSPAWIAAMQLCIPKVLVCALSVCFELHGPNTPY